MTYDFEGQYDIAIEWRPQYSWTRRRWRYEATRQSDGKHVISKSTYGEAINCKWAYREGGARRKAYRAIRRYESRARKRQVEDELKANRKRVINTAQPQDPKVAKVTVESVQQPVRISQGKSFMDRRRKILTNWSDGYGASGTKIADPKPHESPNAVVSLLEGAKKLHAPCIDIDMSCQLIPSATEGHYHLYIDKAMTWDDYLELLDAMVKAGIVEQKWVQASRKEGFTTVRIPPEEDEWNRIRTALERGGDLFEI